jgi:hypothetical protein
MAVKDRPVSVVEQRVLEDGDREGVDDRLVQCRVSRDAVVLVYRPVLRLEIEHRDVIDARDLGDEVVVPVRDHVKFERQVGVDIAPSLNGCQAHGVGQSETDNEPDRVI